jgi:hypothetical protein
MKGSSEEYGVERPYLFGFLVLTLAISISYIYYADFEYLIRLIPDDGYYYLKIARNINDGFGSSFDGITITNGYHPLWLLFLVILDATSDYTTHDFVRVVVFVSILLNALTLIYVYKFTKGFIAIKAVRVLAALSIFTLIASYTVYGMEDSLKYFLVFFLLNYLYEKKIIPSTLLDVLQIGFLILLCVLSRLDLGLLWISYLLAIALKENNGDMTQKKIVTAVVSSAVVLLGLVVYLSINLVLFDVLTPVSGKLKATFPHISDNFMYWADAGIVHRLSVIACGLALIYFFTTVLKSKKKGCVDEAELTLFMMYFTIVGFVVYQILFVNWANTFSWYRLPTMVGAALFFFYLLGKSVIWLKNHHSAVGYVPMVFVILAIPFLLNRLVTSHSSAEDDFPYSIYNAAIWVNDNLPDDAVFALKDTGLFSYYSNRKVINLDGLVNSPDYYHQLIKLGLPGYLEEKGVDFFVDQSLVNSSEEVKSGSYTSYHYSLINRIGEVSIEPLELRRSDEIYRFAYKNDKKTLSIWKLQ